MREEVRHCATCGDATMHRLRLFARSWTCERCAWKRVAAERFDDDDATIMFHFFEFIWVQRPRVAKYRFRPSPRVTHFIDPF